MLQLTGVLDERSYRSQYLDRMDIERERGITIKSQNVRLPWTVDGDDHILHLIDTPGHVDFTYEVSRSLAACEGAILLVDAAQGIEAQTLANVYLALDNDLELIPVINKIDLPAADPDRIAQEVEDVVGLPREDAIKASAKANIGIQEILESIVETVPPPAGDPSAPLKALIFDSIFDPYRGVISSIRIMEGTVRQGDKIRMMATGKEFEVAEVGINTPKPMAVKELTVGDVGFLTAAIKTVGDSRVGDTITLADNPAETPLQGYKKMNPMVFCGMYPIDSNKYNDLRDALEKRELNDR